MTLGYHLEESDLSTNVLLICLIFTLIHYLGFSTSRDLSVPESMQAISGQDYLSQQETLVMVENQTVSSIELKIKADNQPETEEQFLVNITSVR